MNNNDPFSSADLWERWSQGEKYPALKTLWPEVRNYSLKEAATLFQLNQDQTRIEERLELLKKNSLAQVPALVGVIGGKNAGKSSWVSGFLSDGGRQRILTGERFKEGTQRFVFWLPTRWQREQAFSDFFHNLLHTFFEEDPELLPEDPSEAHITYTRRGCMHKPVIAYDENLNDIGLAFLDTPDFQTSLDNKTLEPTSHLRLQWIEKISKLLQCVVFIVSRSDVGNEIFSVPEGYLQSEMRSLPRFLCLNKMRRPEPDILQDEDVAAAIQRFQPEGSFGAYDFAIRNSENWIPNDDHSRRMTEKEVPLFLALPTQEKTDSARSASRTLRDTLLALDGSALANHYQKKLHEQASEEIENLQRSLQKMIIAHGQTLQKCRKELSTQLEQIWPDDADKNILSPEMLALVQKSLTRTAPLYAKTTLWLRGKFSEGKKQVYEFFKNVKNPFGKKIEGTATNEESASMSVFDWEHIIRHSYNTRPTHGLERETLNEAWGKVFATMSHSQLEPDTDKLDKSLRLLWKEVPLYKKFAFGVAPPIIVVSALAAFLTMPIISIGAPFLLQLSIGELLVSLVGADYLSNKSGGQMLASAIKELEVRQRDIFKRSAHIVFGLPDPVLMDRHGYNPAKNNPLQGQPILWPEPVTHLVKPTLLPEQGGNSTDFNINQ